MADVKKLKIPADLAKIDTIREFLREKCTCWPISEEDALKLELSLHEICVNIAMYAYPGGEGELTVRIWQDDTTIFMEIRDRGIPFDPTARPDPDVHENIRKGKRGGLGIYLFKKLMDGYEYRRDDGENILTIYKKLRPAADSSL